VTVRMLYLVFVRVTGWMALLARSAAPKDAELAGAAPGGGSAAAAEPETEAGLGRPDGDRRPGPAAPQVTTDEPAGC
jgi:hypothetical protein